MIDACSINMGDMTKGACGKTPARVVGCWRSVACRACRALWGERSIKCPCEDCERDRQLNPDPIAPKTCERCWRTVWGRRKICAICSGPRPKKTRPW